MQAQAVILQNPKNIVIGDVDINVPGASDVVVSVKHSGISTGTEKLLWSGAMPEFPGMGYPLVPGYEAFGEVVDAGKDSALAVGDHVFVPGANCYKDVRGLFGGASSHLVSDAKRVVKLDAAMGAEGALLALAATAHHALQGPSLPDLIIGHGTLGRLLARLTIALGGPAPTVWETDPDRQSGDGTYRVLSPQADERRDYHCVMDASGRADLIDSFIARLAKGGELVLAGFYAAPISFAFPPAFMKEARLRIAAEWQPEDLLATRNLIETGALSLGDIITHRTPAEEAQAAYETAFSDPACLKMILDWSPAQ